MQARLGLLRLVSDGPPLLHFEECIDVAAKFKRTVDAKERRGNVGGWRRGRRAEAWDGLVGWWVGGGGGMNGR
ncbi:hypothetical protein INR49_009127 [Caranx melampygus]|nr:hypothetical protein INR49_009127 [Caranx melampygus]